MNTELLYKFLFSYSDSIAVWIMNMNYRKSITDATATAVRYSFFVVIAILLKPIIAVFNQQHWIMQLRINDNRRQSIVIYSAAFISQRTTKQRCLQASNASLQIQVTVVQIYEPFTCT